MKPAFPILLHVGSAAWFAAALFVNSSGFVQAQGTATLDALAERVKKLEARIAEDEQQQGAGPGAKAGGSRLRAPFVVTDAQGKDLLVVTEAAGGGAVLRLGQLGSGTAIQLERNAEHARVITQMAGGASEVRLEVSQDKGSRVTVYEGQHSTLIGTGADNKHGLFVRAGDGKGNSQPVSVGELAVTYGESGGILRLHDKSGKQVISAGSNAKEGGRGQFGLGPPGGNVAVLLTHAPDGPGEVGVYGGVKGKPLVEMSGSKHHVLVSNRAGEPAAMVGLNQNGTGNGGTFTATDGAGNNVVKVGSRGEGGGAMCAIHYKRGLECFPQ